MPRLLLAGGPTGCWNNLGDEAIFEGMLASLHASVPGAEVSVVSSCPDGFLEGYGCAPVPFRDIAALQDAVAASDMVVLGGGSIFFDYWGCDPESVLTPRHSGLALWAGIALLAHASHKPLMVYGAGVGPLSSSDGRLLARATLELADAVCVRDPHARQTLEALGVTSHATVTGDPAVALQVSAAGPGWGPKPWLGVALRQWDLGVDQESWQREVAATLDAFLDRYGGTAIIVPCHRPVSWPLTDDEAAAVAVLNRMAHGNRARLIGSAAPWRERAAALVACDAVLAMRYHAALVAMAAGVPAVGVSYDPKVEGLFEDWDVPELEVELAEVTAERLTTLLGVVMAECSARSERLRARGKELRVRESRNADGALALLDDKPPRRPTGVAVHELVGRLDAEARAIVEPLRTGRRHRRTRRRVAILTNRLLDRATGEPYTGGAERYARELGQLLCDLGLEPTFFQREGVWGEGDYFGFPVIALPRGTPFSEFEPGVAAAFFERTHDFDHVLCLMPNYASGPLREDALVVCHGVWWDHELYADLPIRSPEWYEHLERVFMQPRRVVSVDANSMNVVRALFPQAAKRMTWIPSWVDTETFFPPVDRHSDPPLVLFPRRVDGIRGAGLARPIVELVPGDCRFLWAGGGHPVAVGEMRRLAAEEPRFQQREVPLDEMPPLYREADVVAIPTVGSEGQSLACLEAMASGCAIVATHVGGLPELIRHEANGLLCEPTAEAIAAAIRRLLADQGLRERLGRQAREDALRQDLPIWRERWAQVLAELGWTRGGYDVVCFSIIDWEHRWNRPQAMMRAWARRGRRVFYLRISDHLPEGGEPVAAELLEEDVWEVRLALPGPFHLHSGEHPDGFAAIGLEGLRALEERFGISRAVGVIEAAGWYPLAAAARDAFGWPLLYDCMDDWRHFPGIGSQERLMALEERVAAEADCLVVSSGELARRWGAVRSDLVLARNAVDFAAFQRLSGRDPLPGIAGPIAGFIGAIAEWFDADLLAHVARERPNVTFVLVGGIHRRTVPELEALPNVRLEGEQPFAAMPDYLRRFNVCLIPFEVSRTTAAMDVIKVHQYMSVGAPIVSTRISEMAEYAEHLYLAGDRDEYVAQLDRALAEHDPQRRARRIAAASRNTWDERLDRIEAALSGLVCESPRSP